MYNAKCTEELIYNQSTREQTTISVYIFLARNRRAVGSQIRKIAEILRKYFLNNLLSKSVLMYT